MTVISIICLHGFLFFLITKYISVAMLYPYPTVYNVSEFNLTDWYNRVWSRYPSGWIPIYYHTISCLLLINLFSLATLVKERFRSNVLFAYLCAMTVVDLSYLITSLVCFVLTTEGSVEEGEICEEGNSSLTIAATMILNIQDIFGTSTDLVVCCLTMNRFIKVKSIKEKKKYKERRWLAFVMAFAMVILNLVIHIPQFFAFQFEYRSTSDFEAFKANNCWIALPAE